MGVMASYHDTLRIMALEKAVARLEERLEELMRLLNEKGKKRG